ncbi:CAP domain-containing protein [soil metagenome]
MPTTHHALPRLFTALTLALIASAAVAAQPDGELVSALNAVRAFGCSGRPGVATPLMPNAQLAQAAKGLADGLKLPDAMARQDYRATRTNNLWLSGPAGVKAVTDMVATNYCAVLTEPALIDIGVYQQGVQTWVVLATPFAPVSSTQSGEVATRVLELVNAARSQARTCGDKPFAAVGPVKLNATLSTVAMGHAQDMAAHSYFAHQARDGSSPSDRATRGGYRWRAVGENIAAGQTTPDAAVEGWIKSPPHCANLMGQQYAEMGVAFAVNKTSEAGIYWVQMFGTQR